MRKHTPLEAKDPQDITLEDIWNQYGGLIYEKVYEELDRYEQPQPEMNEDDEEEDAPKTPERIPFEAVGLVHVILPELLRKVQENYNRDIASLCTYVGDQTYWLARTACIKEFKQRAKERTGQHDQVRNKLDRGTHKPIPGLQGLRDLLHTLPEDQQHIIRQRYWEDKSEISIAKELGISRQAVNKNLNRALRNLQVPAAAGGVSQASLEALCEQSRRRKNCSLPLSVELDAKHSVQFTNPLGQKLSCNEFQLLSRGEQTHFQNGKLHRRNPLLGDLLGLTTAMSTPTLANSI